MRTPAIYSCIVGFALLLGSVPAAAETIDLTGATVVTRSGNLSQGEKIAATVLIEELATRTGETFALSSRMPEDGPVIVLGSRERRGRSAYRLPEAIASADGAGAKAEGFTVYTETQNDRPVLWLIGADGRGALFAAGYLLRKADWGLGTLSIDGPILESTSPEYPIRGHQLGYREHSNSYDAFTVERYDQYIRELALFGANAVEQIPFQDDRISPHFPLPRREMNLAVSAICAKYDMDNWLWVPVGDLTNPEIKAAALKEHEDYFRESARVDALFFPGGDPGDNPPQLVLPYMEELAKVLHRFHPKAKMWLSLQGFSDPDAEFVYAYIDEHEPTWMGGIVCGPSSPPIVQTRARLHSDYPIRSYPDITHTVRSDYPTVWWDPAFSLTLGREPINPEPVRYTGLHDYFAPYTAGFISYSDGVNDDINKAVWSRRAWGGESLHETLRDYANCFFGSEVAEETAAGILGLELNWRGSLADNGSVDGTFALWDALDKRSPQLKDNWRWIQCQLRANYDMYTRHRLLYEQSLEREANAILNAQAVSDPDAALAAAWSVLEKGETERIRKDQYDYIIALADNLFAQIGQQTSVERHQASGTQRGCIIDLIHYPLFNRWWLEDEFAKVSELPTPESKTARLLELANWENPGPGSFYDDIGTISRMPRRIEGENLLTDPLTARNPDDGIMWWDNGSSRQRVSWQTYMTRTLGLRYDGLDPAATYTIKATGFGSPIVKADGYTLTMNEPGVKEIGEVFTFDIPRAAFADGSMIITWERPGEDHLNWRQHSRMTEVWLMKE